MPDSTALAKLHDIHMPSPISWWPLAPGWYVLLALLILLCALSFFLIQRAYKNNQAKREALLLLDSYKKEYLQGTDSQSSSMRVSELLRRVALVYFSRASVAGLEGDAWISFLAKHSKGIDFSQIRPLLLDAPFKPSTECDLLPLFVFAKAWIQQRGKRCSN